MPSREALLQEIAALQHRIAVLERPVARRPVDPAFRGQEVSCRPMGAFFEAIRARGIPPSVLAEGTGYPPEQFEDPRRRVSWAAFRRFMENAGKLFTDDELAAIGGVLPRSPALRAMLVVAQLLYSVTDAYRWVFGPGGPATGFVTSEDAEIRQVGPRELELELTMKPGYAPSRENFVTLVGALRSLSVALGSAPAVVELELLADGARYRVALPEGGGKLGWLRRAFTWPFAARAAADELRRANEALNARYAELQATLEQMPIGCVRSDADGRILYVNAAIEHIFACRPIDLIGVPLWDAFAPAEHRAVLKDSFVRATRGEDVPRTRTPGTTRAGAPLVCEWTHRSLISPHAEAAVLSMVEDVTERHRLQEQLVQSRKMEAIGQLAAGVAHDFNNLLTVILGYGEVVRDGLAGDAPLRADVEQMTAAAERAAALTRQLLAFSRRQVFSPRRVDLAALIGELRGILDRLLGEGIAVQWPTSSAEVVVDPDQISQVVLNLAVNARDAMPDGGTLSFVLDEIGVSPEVAAEQSAVAGPFVRLRVTDTGIGMDEATRSRVFDPFFTTKGPGKGTGLGLSTVYGIVRQSGGFVTVDSAVGQGSTFTVYLPAPPGE